MDALQDVTELHLTESDGQECTEKTAKYICPVSHLSMNGSHKYAHACISEIISVILACLG